MTQMTPAQARVVDPILSEHARGYRRPGNVARALFPITFVRTYGGRVIEFGKESFLLYNSRRAPGGATKRIGFGYEGKPFAIVPSALEAKVPRELMRDAEEVPGVDLASRAVNLTMSALELEHEFNCAQLARDPSNYDDDHKLTLSGTSRWTDSNSDPAKDIEAAKEAIRSTIGVYPNTVVLSPSAMSALRLHPKILDRIKYTGRETPTPDILASLWGVRKVVVGEAVAATEADGAFGDVWGDDVIVAYVSQSEGAAGFEEPSYGYTYAIEGMPLVEKPYWDANAKSWIYGVSYDNSPVLSGMTAGFLLQNAGQR